MIVFVTAACVSTSLNCWCAERDISKGEQLLHTYGDLSDAQLLQTYGFVEEFGPGFDNPHNFVPVPSVLVLQSCQEAAHAGQEVCSSAEVMCLEINGRDTMQHHATTPGTDSTLWIPCTVLFNLQMSVPGPKLPLDGRVLVCLQ